MTDMDEPVAGVTVVRDGVLGRSGADGRWRGEILGIDGQQIRLALEPPPGHRALSPTSIEVRLHVAAPLGASRAAPQPVRATLRLAPPVRQYVLLVRAEGRAGSPVLLDGLSRGQTDAWGAATLLHHGRPGTRLVVTIAGAAGSAPRSEVRRAFVLPDRDDILLVDVAAPRPGTLDRPRPRARPVHGGTDSPAPRRRRHALKMSFNQP